jgi:uncharacterized protein YndB with AHSA1/START domain
MPSPFSFDRSWTFEVPPAELWGALTDADRYRSWWPWLRRFDTGGQPLGEGTVARCTVRAPLPYALDFTVTVVEMVPERRLVASVAGDLAGPARLEVAEAPEGSRATLAWTVELRAPILRAASRIARPVMEWGHDWVVDSGVRQFRARALEP